MSRGCCFQDDDPSDFDPHADAHRPPDDDPVCEHGTAWDVHCCGCHSGFLFDLSACVCFDDDDDPEPLEGDDDDPYGIVDDDPDNEDEEPDDDEDIQATNGGVWG
ncbi:MAG: hypothetical protein ACRD15_05655 [Vicinamibacterales bacterium]